MAEPSFLWFLHQPASARWLKRELAKRGPALRFAFSRPGLSTFKLEGELGEEQPSCIFARAAGRSMGAAQDVAGVLARADALGAGPLRLHVFERDPERPADERDPAVAGTRAAALDTALRAAAPGRFLEGVESRPGERVLDVITAAAERPDDGIFVGWHRAGVHARWPGGVEHARVPEAAPSRAYAKIEEAIEWSGIAPRPGEHVVELGSSPGGISYALLERGLEVHGVDPGAMAPAVLGYRGSRGNRFVHLHKPAAEVERRELPRPMHWLTSDMNLAPMVGIKYVERMVALGRGELRGAFLTLKIHDEGIIEALPSLLQRIEKLGARELRCTQLPSHRAELVAILRF